MTQTITEWVNSVEEKLVTEKKKEDSKRKSPTPEK